jgi:hypothetical protein
VGPGTGIRDIEVVAPGLGLEPGVRVVLDTVPKRRLLALERPVLVCLLVYVRPPLAVDEHVHGVSPWGYSGINAVWDDIDVTGPGKRGGYGASTTNVCAT